MNALLRACEISVQELTDHVGMSAPSIRETSPGLKSVAWSFAVTAALPLLRHCSMSHFVTTPHCRLASCAPPIKSAGSALGQMS
jgi:hypothetical protein